MNIQGLCFHILFRGNKKKLLKYATIYLIYTKYQLCLTLDGFIQEKTYTTIFLVKLFTVTFHKHTAKEMTGIPRRLLLTYWKQ